MSLLHYLMQQTVRHRVLRYFHRHGLLEHHVTELDNGAPVSPFTVGKELGHGGTAMVERVYSHLGEVRHRSEVVEYQIKHHREALGKRLTKLEKLTT